MNNRKALIVGGSSGIGAELSAEMIREGYYVVIVDKSQPDDVFSLDKEKYEWIESNLVFFDEELFLKLAQDNDIDVLFITAGFGRVAPFETFTSNEIDTMLSVNSSALIKIISLFYNRLISKKTFLCGVMGSIAGLLSSPLASVYAASKASVCRFIESVNIELEMSGTENRILNVSPGSIRGTRFNGAGNIPNQNRGLALEIIDHMRNREPLWIPDYDTTFCSVIERYQKDAHAFGIDSYRYKEQSGRMNEASRFKVGYMSGTFDLFHIGHLNLIKNARNNCDYLIVGVHSDGKWKGKETFIPLDERKEILRSCKYVDRVVDSCVEDSDAWDLYHYDRLFVGSDYKGTERFKRYEEYFSDKNVEIIYFPYTMSTSSTQIRELINKKNEEG